MGKMLEWATNKRVVGCSAPLLELTNVPAGDKRGDGRGSPPGGDENVPFSLADVTAMLARNQELLQNL